ncbi:hypothetical protein N271_gp25 [Salmonella phage Jersey]|uniref:Uncharacterized protein n=1 Tax=Salmonella phage Jersey TaxID=1340534 RepID=S4WXW4_9CAUD|nr:hypothetical protein N271_gp25 [Salmonella phage Jersey]AGP24913.1 hypothetical protein Jersey_25 [Salmonella phage Jersey]
MRALIALGLFAVSLQSLAHPCETVFNETVLNTSGVLDGYDQKLVYKFRTSAIDECIAAEKIGKTGLPAQVVTYSVISSVGTDGDAFYSLLTATRLQMVLAGWGMGVESK